MSTTERIAAQHVDRNADDLALVANRFAVAITEPMQDLVDPADPDDPIAKQFMPDVRELAEHPDELCDPIGDDRHS
ncbi:MAG: lysine 2,3-aminomutase, partial [Gammaproteobacteria bacterium]|nr:lysine 2,3-aminomutase [Gammaproteobacteria bacterium]